MTRYSKVLADAEVKSFWLDNTSETAPCPPLTEDATAQLLIIGGGFTGLWAAIQAKERHPALDVVLIERDRVAHGASGRPGGIISTSVMHGLKNEARVFPDDIDSLEDLGQQNLDGFRASVERYGIDADIEWVGEMKVAIVRDHMPELEEEYQLHLRHGHDVVMLDETQVREQLNLSLLVGGMWSRQRSGVVHPAKLAWGLKKAALALGVRMHESTSMLSYAQDGRLVRVTTQFGTIMADKVLFATNAWVNVDKRIKRRVIAVRDRVLATEPLTAEQLARIGWQNRQGIYDTRTQLSYFRLTADNRIIFGGHVDYFFGNNTAPTQDNQRSTYHGLVDTFQRTFPQLSDVKISHVWSGPIDYCKRAAMYFERLMQDRVVWVGGYSGFGVAGSRFGASTALDILFNLDTPATALDIAKTLPGVIPPEPLRWAGTKLTFHAIAGADLEGGWKAAWIDAVRRVGFPI
jgi:glycine/D-amino acid oxidase-like deaminating enzyme